MVQLRAVQQACFREVKERNHLLHVSRSAIQLTDCWRHVSAQAACWQPDTSASFSAWVPFVRKRERVFEGSSLGSQLHWGTRPEVTWGDIAVFNTAYFLGELTSQTATEERNNGIAMVLYLWLLFRCVLLAGPRTGINSSPHSSCCSWTPRALLSVACAFTGRWSWGKYRIGTKNKDTWM